MTTRHTAAGNTIDQHGDRGTAMYALELTRGELYATRTAYVKHYNATLRAVRRKGSKVRPSVAAMELAQYRRLIDRVDAMLASEVTA